MNGKKILLNAEGRVDHDKSLRGELSHDIDPQKTKLAISANWYHDKFTLTPLVSYDSNQEIQATVNLGLSSIYDTTDNKIKIIPNNGSGKGIARAFVYFDKNGNNIFDGTDEALPDVRVMTVQTFRSALTDENGVALISNIPEYTATDITVDTSTLSDLYYILGRPGNSVYARPGKVTKIEFPVHLSGELDGRVNIESSDRLRTEKSINGLQVQLINERGEVEMSTVTAFDGYFVFSTVPPGKYLVSINSDDLKKISLRQPLPQYIEVGYEGKVISGQDIKLTPGTEIPITVYKDKNTDPINATDFIALDFGSYRSELLAQLIRFKMAHSLRRNDIRLNIDVLAVKDDHDKNYRLETMIINDNLSRAQEICGIAAESNIACSVKVPTKLLFDHLSHNKAPSGLSFDTKPATVL